uniref:ISXO2-like transposase domain-containing protein n=1 Tax=Ditylenchus dipsaci TaxID=166011 RepID=A0A915CP57_9BILA
MFQVQYENLQKTKQQHQFSLWNAYLSWGPKCNGECGFLSSSFLSGSIIPVVVVLKFIYMWLANMELTKICDEIAISSEASVEWSRFCRRAVYFGMITLGEAIGGLGDVVESDESKFGKRNYNRGHYVQGSWVFGGIYRLTGSVFMVQVEKRDRDTLLPLCQRWIKKDSIIIADCWRAYDSLEELGYQLLRVNHSLTFKTAEEDVPDCFPTHVKKAVHTNSIEASWGAVKRMIFRQPGSRARRHLPGNLANVEEQQSSGEKVECSGKEQRCSKGEKDSPPRFTSSVGDRVVVPWGRTKKMYEAVVTSVIEANESSSDKCYVQFDDKSVAIYRRNKFSDINVV